MKFEIRLYEAFKNVCFYTVFLNGNELCETDQFFQRFSGEPSLVDDVSEIAAIIKQIGEYGARPERFRDEDNAHALPRTPNNLRLYCVRCGQGTVILCGGGRKTSQKVQQSPDAYPHFQLAKRVEAVFRERIQEGEIHYNGKFLEGNLFFDSEDIH